MKLNLDALKEKPEATALINLLATIIWETWCDCYGTPATLTGSLPTNISKIPNKLIPVLNSGRLHD